MWDGSDGNWLIHDGQNRSDYDVKNIGPMSKDPEPTVPVLLLIQHMNTLMNRLFMLEQICSHGWASDSG